MALPKVGDGEQIGDGNTNETLNVGASGQTVQVAGAAATLLGFHGTSPTAQHSTFTTLTLTTVLSSGFGFQTSAGFTAAVTAINSIIDTLRGKGLVA